MPIAFLYINGVISPSYVNDLCKTSAHGTSYGVPFDEKAFPRVIFLCITVGQVCLSDLISPRTASISKLDDFALMARRNSVIGL